MHFTETLMLNGRIPSVGTVGDALDAVWILVICQSGSTHRRIVTYQFQRSNRSSSQLAGPRSQVDPRIALAMAVQAGLSTPSASSVQTTTPFGPTRSLEDSDIKRSTV